MFVVLSVLFLCITSTIYGSFDLYNEILKRSITNENSIVNEQSKQNINIFNEDKDNSFYNTIKRDMNIGELFTTKILLSKPIYSRQKIKTRQNIISQFNSFAKIHELSEINNKFSQNEYAFLSCFKNEQDFTQDEICEILYATKILIEYAKKTFTLIILIKLN